jgi:hypothetical protein
MERCLPVEATSNLGGQGGAEHGRILKKATGCACGEIR